MRTEQRFTPTATVLCDSISESGHRVTTIECEHHRFVLPELLTHRVASRNGQSNRACPARKQIDAAQNETAWPMAFGTNQPGMQPGPNLTGDEEAQAYAIWADARDAAIEHAERLLALNVHKQVVNRLLEPFLRQRTIVTATAWGGFFDQRATPEGGDEGLAQIEMRVLADAVRAAMAKSEPTLVPAGGWHLPLIQPDEADLDLDTKIKVSVARCARVSYLTHAGVRDLFKDEDLYSDLVSETPPHWSPLEHVCTPDPGNVQTVTAVGTCGQTLTHTVPKLGNLLGWSQNRHRIEADRFGSVAA